MILNYSIKFIIVIIMSKNLIILEGYTKTNTIYKYLKDYDKILNNFLFHKDNIIKFFFSFFIIL